MINGAGASSGCCKYQALGSRRLRQAAQIGWLQREHSSWGQHAVRGGSDEILDELAGLVTATSTPLVGPAGCAKRLKWDLNGLTVLVLQAAVASIKLLWSRRLRPAAQIGWPAMATRPRRSRRLRQAAQIA